MDAVIEALDRWVTVGEVTDVPVAVLGEDRINQCMHVLEQAINSDEIDVAEIDPRVIPLC